MHDSERPGGACGTHDEPVRHIQSRGAGRGGRLLASAVRIGPLFPHMPTVLRQHMQPHLDLARKCALPLLHRRRHTTPVSAEHYGLLFCTLSQSTPRTGRTASMQGEDRTAGHTHLCYPTLIWPVSASCCCCCCCTAPAVAFCDACAVQACERCSSFLSTPTAPSSCRTT